MVPLTTMRMLASGMQRFVQLRTDRRDAQQEYQRSQTQRQSAHKCGWLMT